ncbi:hypothetical protein D1631_00270 [Chryseobacterium nematophagum]|uniref:Uncharacterized protein n=1 Tax=Chryseobacterium nematophagum TaxID=2305228 RepID=A0A3M7TK67_9FLAO|nr:hypothetical protein [Chryseobacterium nematophagum]RNA63951.1 hypothetical protein D1631_00120 [Chryseobacterium nematophagum]RNA63978.1 hypothetical protein D1631_00270 [Chryseobacterium nematophagum]
MKSIVMHRILNFIHNNNIDIVEEIFKDKVGTGTLTHILNKKESYKKQHNDNIKVWFEFISHLDDENSEILYHHINSKTTLKETP